MGSTWESATINAPGVDGSTRIGLGSGPDYARVLAPQFRFNDGSDYAMFGYGVHVIDSGVSESYADATDFDGTNDWLTRGGELTGNADGKAGTFFCAIKFNGGDGSTQRIVSLGATNKLAIVKTTGNKIQITGLNAASATILSFLSTTSLTTSTTWTLILASWNLATGTTQLYFSDTDVKSGTVTATDDIIDYTNPNHAIGATVAGGNKLNACVARVFLDLSTAIDISVEANRRKFFTAVDSIVSFGADGSTPLGVQPIIYLPNAFGTFQNNAGSGGNFAVTGGALTACAGNGPVLA